MITKQVYSVNDISKILGVHTETVKRWLRSGKLKGECDAKRYGYVVSADDLEEFISSNPKMLKWIGREEDRAFVNFCKELLVDLINIESERLGSEDHGKVWNDGFEDALRRVEGKIKEKIVARETPLSKARYYAGI